MSANQTKQYRQKNPNVVIQAHVTHTLCEQQHDMYRNVKRYTGGIVMVGSTNCKAEPGFSPKPTTCSSCWRQLWLTGNVTRDHTRTCIQSSPSTAEDQFVWHLATLKPMHLSLIIPVGHQTAAHGDSSDYQHICITSAGHSIMCTNAYNEQKLWETLILVSSLLNILGPINISGCKLSCRGK